MIPYNKNNPQSIQKMFGSIARQYDRTNALLSLQMHRYWNYQLIKTIIKKPHSMTYLDLCCGTGEIALKYLEKKSSCQAYLLDFCPEMLACAKDRLKKLSPLHSISYLEADAQEIPLPSNSIDNATMAYGIRNIPNPQRCFHEIYRVLKEEGTIGILELTQPQNRLLRLGHHLYLTTLVPRLGKILTANHEAYQYLCNSIKTFSHPLELEKLLKNAGFKKTFVKPLMGGVATILIAQK